MKSETAIEIKDLTLKYGFKTAVDSISFELKRGQSIGLLGLNGAGKTSTIRAVLGMLAPKDGSVHVFGETPGTVNALSLIGFAPEDGMAPEFLTTLEFLELIYSLKMKTGKAREECKKSLEWFELADNKRTQDLSKGMNRRLTLAQAFLGNPPLLILDEPLNGLDPLMIIKLRDKIAEYRSQGGTVLYCSHILSEVERCCTEIIIMNEGKIAYQATVEKAKSEFGDVEHAFAKFAGKA